MGPKKTPTNVYINSGAVAVARLFRNTAILSVFLNCKLKVYAASSLL